MSTLGEPLSATAQKVESVRSPSTPQPVRAPLPTTPVASPPSPVSTDCPIKRFNRAAQATDEQLRTLSEQSSLCTTLWLMHPAARAPQDFQQFCELMRHHAQEPGIPLWTLYSEHFGRTLSWTQRIKARIVCWACYETGIVPGLMQTVLSNMLSQARSKWADNKLRVTIQQMLPRLLIKFGEFLDQYNSASRDYLANRNQASSLHEQRTAQLGKDLEQLCRDFTLNLLNEANGCMTGIHWLYRKILARYLPTVVHNLTTHCLKLFEENPVPLQTGVANFIAEQLEAFTERMQAGTLSKSQVPYVAGGEELHRVIPKFLDAVDFTTKPQNPLESRSSLNLVHSQFRSRITPILIDACQAGLQVLVEQPERMEILTEQTFALVGRSFELPSGVEPNPVAAQKRLMTAARGLLACVIEDPKSSTEAPPRTDQQRLEDATRFLHDIGQSRDLAFCLTALERFEQNLPSQKFQKVLLIAAELRAHLLAMQETERIAKLEDEHAQLNQKAVGNCRFVDWLGPFKEAETLLQGGEVGDAAQQLQEKGRALPLDDQKRLADFCKAPQATVERFESDKKAFDASAKALKEAKQQRKAPTTPQAMQTKFAQLQDAFKAATRTGLGQRLSTFVTSSFTKLTKAVSSPAKNIVTQISIGKGEEFIEKAYHFAVSPHTIRRGACIALEALTEKR